jgi:hypothetical protein
MTSSAESSEYVTTNFTLPPASQSWWPLTDAIGKVAISLTKWTEAKSSYGEAQVERKRKARFGQGRDVSSSVAVGSTFDRLLGVSHL